VTDDALVVAARAWLADDPDPETRAELEALLNSNDDGALADRFSGTLAFGTAGLRAELGAGPMRMNEAVVRRAAWGVGRYLLDGDGDRARARGVVVGFDARHKSRQFADASARVLAAQGIAVHLFDTVVPTPVLAFAVTELGCVAGVMVTASHNPPADNGYKVYVGTGAQIVPPVDTQIAARIDVAPSPASIAVADLDDPLIGVVGPSLLEAYLDHVAAVRLVPDANDVTVAYTPMHGVGGGVVVSAFRRSGFAAPSVVAAQADPDPDFPTVAFPNPEEPGAMDLLMAQAAAVGADIAIANDPDADRMAAAVPTPEGAWRRLRGDEIGWLLADHILTRTAGDDRLVVTTLVSSTLLAAMAADHHVHHAETYTGFKWIAHEILAHPEWTFVFGYEQALGYLVAARPLDKDGISAAVLMAEVAAVAKSSGTTLLERLAALEARYGRHETVERSVRMTPADAAAVVARLRADPPASLAGRKVAEVRSIEEAGLLRLTLDDGARVQIRPSGTEPKVKLYAEAVGYDPTPLLDALVF
jgi:phosphomannomutase